MTGYAKSKDFRSSDRVCSIKKVVFKNFAIYTGKHLCWNLVLIKVQVFMSGTLLKKDSYENYKFFKKTHFEEHLRTAASAIC